MRTIRQGMHLIHRGNLNSSRRPKREQKGSKQESLVPVTASIPYVYWIIRAICERPWALRRNQRGPGLVWYDMKSVDWRSMTMVRCEERGRGIRAGLSNMISMLTSGSRRTVHACWAELTSKRARGIEACEWKRASVLRIRAVERWWEVSCASSQGTRQSKNVCMHEYLNIWINN